MFLHFHPLEPRRLLAATLSPAGVLEIFGTRRGDVITVERAGPGDRHVLVTITSRGREFQYAFRARNVKSILANAGRGGDKVSIGDALPNATLYGSTGNDSLTGGAGNDQIFGGNGNDTLLGTGGNDLLGGNNGADFLHGGPGADGLFGNNGADTVSYSGSSLRAGVTLTLDGRANDGFANEQDNVSSDVEILVGTGWDDHITGNDQGNTVRGGSGNDTVLGMGGDDDLDGGPDYDSLVGGDGNDRLHPGAGDWSHHRDWAPIEPVTSIAVANVLVGGNGDDTLFSDEGDDLMSGGPGNDTADYSTYGPYTGADISLDGLRNDGFRQYSMDHPGTPEFYEAEFDNVGADVENVVGTYNVDKIVGNDADNRLVGGGYEDSLIGGAGNDTLVGDGGDTYWKDSLEGGTGDDTFMTRDNSADTLDGGPGNDRAQLDEDEDERSSIEAILA
jgi:Ca2+-binding RTX toxin-like protein